jgi:hypothetical protein
MKGVAMMENRQSDLLSNVRQFLGFLSGLWGMFSSLTLLFPLSNALVQVLPMHETLRGIYTALTTLTCCFVILYLYITRHQQIAVRLAKPSLYDRRVIAIFALGILSALLYLPIHSSYAQILEGSYSAVYLEQGMMWVLGILSYGTAFVGLTTSFTLLAIVEYSKQSGETEYLASRREEVLRTENQELKEKLTELQRHLETEKQEHEEELAELQRYVDRLRTRLALYEEEERVLQQTQLVTAVGQITQSAVANTLKQRILEIAGVKDAILSMTVRGELRGIEAMYEDSKSDWRYDHRYSGPKVNWIDMSVFLILEAGTDISVATEETKSVAKQVLDELRLGAGKTSVSLDYA